jgi:hypothetical protein
MMVEEIAMTTLVVPHTFLKKTDALLITNNLRWILLFMAAFELCNALLINRGKPCSTVKAGVF